MWPVVLFGAAALLLALLFVVRPTWARLALAAGFALVTMGAGCLGSVMGIRRSTGVVTHVEHVPEFLVGVRESLGNLALALGEVIVVVLLCTVGVYRLLSAPPAEKHRGEGGDGDGDG